MPGSWEALGTGGPIITILALLSLVSWVLIVVKILQLWTCRSGTALRATAFQQWQSGDKHGAQTAVAGEKSRRTG